MRVNVRLVIIAISAASIAFPALAQVSGKAVFTQNCAICHGPDGKANTAMGRVVKAQDIHASAIMKAPDAQLIAAVKKGKGKMPEFGSKLSDAQIEAVIEYVRSLEKK